MILPIALLVVFLGTVSAACDNQCSGHGACQIDDVCKCYDNWGVGLSHDSGDCSDRVCPFEIAWVDTPSTTDDTAVGRFHRYAECAGRGVCNRQTGECQCFDGYEGKACKRTTCPNDCSGHGTCEYIDDLYFADTWNEYSTDEFQDDPKTFEYNGWDTRKTRGCICDATYGDIDCSKRMCPYGTDVLAVRDDLLVTAKYHKQTITFQFADGAPTTDTATFALTFRSRLNETFTTIPIKYDTSDLDDLEVDVRLSLLSLPNRVIDGVSVSASQISGEVTLVVTFTGDSVQGPQHLLTVQSYECSEGCTPRITGLVVDTLVAGTEPTIEETQTSDYNSYECGRRGKCDYSTGLCQCFTGYTGDNCNTLTTLV